MSLRILDRIGFAAVMLFCTVASASAQTYGNYAPYSIYGIGDFHQGGTAWNKSMGGVGIAGRDPRFINILNPAAITARDTLSFMADFSLYSDNKVYSQGSMKSASNTFNIGDLVMSFPILSKNSAFFIGVAPLTGTGYNVGYNYSDPEVIGKTGPVSYSARGQGAMYQAFLGAGATFFKRLSVGAEALYYFGRTEKVYTGTFASTSYSGVKNGYDMSLQAVTGKFGLQYEHPVGTRSTISIGATYTLDTDLAGYVEAYSYSTGDIAVDTLYHKVDTLLNSRKVKLAGEVGVGIAFRYGDNFTVEFDYTRSDWTRSGMDTTPGFMGNTITTSSISSFGAGVAEAFRVGLEYVPNRNDVRYYFNKVAYRGGAYYKKEYYKVDGHDIVSMGITLGATFPVVRLSNGITVGVELGQRGSLTGNLIRERYCNFSIGFNLYDIWFQKNQYY